MDGLLLMVWVVRLLFLALLYLFLARVVRSLLRDLRAAAREPGASLGRLVVIESPPPSMRSLPTGVGAGMSRISAARTGRSSTDERSRRWRRLGSATRWRS